MYNGLAGLLKLFVPVALLSPCSGILLLQKFQVEIVMTQNSRNRVPGTSCQKSRPGGSSRRWTHRLLWRGIRSRAGLAPDGRRHTERPLWCGGPAPPSVRPPGCPPGPGPACVLGPVLTGCPPVAVPLAALLCPCLPRCPRVPPWAPLPHVGLLRGRPAPASHWTLLSGALLALVTVT